MEVRKATYHDVPFIKLYLVAQGFSTSNSRLVEQLTGPFAQPEQQVLICLEQESVTGLAVLHWLPQLVGGPLLVISFQAGGSDSTLRALDLEISRLARDRPADRIHQLRS